MSAEKAHKDNSGVLFPNSEKWQAVKAGRPDFGGECTVNGRRFRLAGWKHQSRQAGVSDYISLAFSVPNANGVLSHGPKPGGKP